MDKIKLLKSDDKFRNFVVISQSCSIYKLPPDLTMHQNLHSSSEEPQSLSDLSRSQVLDLDDVIRNISFFSSCYTIKLVKNKKIVLFDENKFFIYDLETGNVQRVGKASQMQRYHYNVVGFCEQTLLVTDNYSTIFSLPVLDSERNMRIISWEGIVLATCSAIETSDIYLSVFNPKLGNQFIMKFSTLEDIELLREHFKTTQHSKASVLPNTCNIFNFQVISHTDNTLRIWALVHQAVEHKSIFRRDASDRKEINAEEINFSAHAILSNIKLNEDLAVHVPCMLVELIFSENVQEKVIACENNYNQFCIFCKPFFKFATHYSDGLDIYHKSCSNCCDTDLNAASCLAFNGVDIVFVSDLSISAVHQYSIDGCYIGVCLDRYHAIERPLFMTFENGQLFVAGINKIFTFNTTCPSLGKLNNVMLSTIKQLLCLIESIYFIDPNRYIKYRISYNKHSGVYFKHFMAMKAFSRGHRLFFLVSQGSAYNYWYMFNQDC